MIYSEGFSPLIFEATRITENSISCIDHIHSNFISYSTSGSIAYKVADHLPVFAVVYDPKHQPFPNTIEYRDFRKFQRQAFRNDLRKEIWTSVFKSSDPNESLSRFLHLFNNISNKHAPLKILKTKNKPNKPWVTIGLKKSIKMCDKLYKQWLVTRDVSFYDRYKTYRNKIAIINKLYRTSYYNGILSEPNNSKKMWDNINLIINKKTPSSTISEIKVDSKHYTQEKGNGKLFKLNIKKSTNVSGRALHHYTQPTSIANNINNYVCNVPRDLAAKLPHKGNKFKSYLPRKMSKFKFSKVSELEVFLLLEGMDKTKSFGLDKIHPFLLQSSAIEIYQPLTFIINLSLKTGVFPESLKIAKVIPIFKQGCRLLFNNYRPISILLALSKIFEKCVLNQITFYFILEGLFTDNQYGFRRGRTTTDCLVYLIEKITLALDQGEYALSIFLDLSKAFDTVNHSNLLTKLIYYGIEDMENQWFDSYLHKQCRSKGRGRGGPCPPSFFPKSKNRPV